MSTFVTVKFSFIIVNIRSICWDV